MSMSGRVLVMSTSAKSSSNGRIKYCCLNIHIWLTEHECG